MARRTMAGLCAAAALWTLVAATDASAKAPRSFYGVVPQTALTSADFDRMKSGRVGTLRIGLYWSSVDPSPAAGDYDWSAVDAIVAGAAASGVRVLPFLYGTPTWVTKGIDGRSCSIDCEIYAPTSQAARVAWATFVRDVAARYGRGGAFWTENPFLRPVPITAYQVWNEPNSRDFFKPSPNPRSYAKLLASAADAIRSVDRRADVVLGGIPELAGAKSAIKGSRFLARLYGVKGAKRSFDGVAPHPYGAKVERVKEQIDLLRDVIERSRDPRVDLWITEIGWSSARGGNPFNRGPRGQATRLRQAFRYFASKRRALHVKAVTWYSWQDSPDSICAWCGKSGLLGPGLTEKPAWRTFVRLTGGR